MKKCIKIKLLSPEEEKRFANTDMSETSFWIDDVAIVLPSKHIQTPPLNNKVVMKKVKKS